VSWVTRAIQGLILFSTALGVFFLWQAYPLLPAFAFEIVAFGWVLFLADSILTFVRPTASYYLGLVLALIALGETLSQQAHYALVESGNVTATATLVAGSAAQGMLIPLVIYYLVSRRKKDPWAWPGASSQA
jgi:hypothetical protein